eukprot:4669-Heterococcus_DN1.PRE.2
MATDAASAEQSVQSYKRKDEHANQKGALLYDAECTHSGSCLESARCACALAVVTAQCTHAEQLKSERKVMCS